MTFSLLQSAGATPIACLDVETTGASSELGDRIVEIGIVRYEYGKVVAEYQQLIDPRRRISPGASAITGITDEMCKGQPTFGQAWPKCREMLLGAALLGHNIPFDLSFLMREAARGANLCRSFAAFRFWTRFGSPGGDLARGNSLGKLRGGWSTSRRSRIALWPMRRRRGLFLTSCWSRSGDGMSRCAIC